MNEDQHRELASIIMAATSVLKPCNTLTDNEMAHMKELQKEVNRLLVEHGAFGAPGTIPTHTNINNELDSPTRLSKKDM